MQDNDDDDEGDAFREKLPCFCKSCAGTRRLSAAQRTRHYRLDGFARNAPQSVRHRSRSQRRARAEEQEHSDDAMDGCDAEEPRMPDGDRHAITKCRLKWPPSEDDVDEFKDEYALAASCLLLSVKTRFQVQGTLLHAVRLLLETLLPGSLKSCIPQRAQKLREKIVREFGLSTLYIKHEACAVCETLFIGGRAEDEFCEACGVEEPRETALPFFVLGAFTD